MKRTWFAVALMLVSASAPALARPKNVYDSRSHYVNQRYGGSARDPWVGANRDVYVNNQDTNSCLEGSVIGGLLGAALGLFYRGATAAGWVFRLVVPLVLCWAAKWMGADSFSVPTWSQNLLPRWLLVRGFAWCANSLARGAHRLTNARVGSSRHQAAA